MFNVSYQRVGGIKFLKIGRITISLSVTSKEAFEAKQRKIARHSNESFLDEMSLIAIRNVLHTELTNHYQKSQRRFWDQYATYTD